MLLDAGCDKKYIDKSIACKLRGKPIRYERKVLDTIHGDKAHNCAIYKLQIKDLKGQFTFTTEAASFNKLTKVKNVRPNVKEKYNHLKDIEFSDVSDSEELDVHLIIGLEDLCMIRTGRMVRGRPGEPIAEETKLGWTLFGPIETTEPTKEFPASLMFARDANELSKQADRL